MTADEAHDHKDLMKAFDAALAPLLPLPVEYQARALDMLAHLIGVPATALRTLRANGGKRVFSDKRPALTR